MDGEAFPPLAWKWASKIISNGDPTDRPRVVSSFNIQIKIPPAATRMSPLVARVSLQLANQVFRASFDAVE